jgi:hypothetical protein
MFNDDFLKRFHDEKEDGNYTKLTYLYLTGTISDYTHEWEILAIRNHELTDT